MAFKRHDNRQLKSCMTSTEREDAPLQNRGAPVLIRNKSLFFAPIFWGVGAPLLIRKMLNPLQTL